MDLVGLAPNVGQRNGKNSWKHLPKHTQACANMASASTQITLATGMNSFRMFPYPKHKYANQQDSLIGLLPIVAAPPAETVGQPAGSITVELSLPQAGGANLEVSWTDTAACTQLYTLYHRPGADSTAYISLEPAATASTVNSKNLSFAFLSGDSLISAWCGTNSEGRKVAEVEINPTVEGTYSSASPSGEGIAAVTSR